MSERKFCNESSVILSPAETDWISLDKNMNVNSFNNDKFRVLLKQLTSSQQYH